MTAPPGEDHWQLDAEEFCAAGCPDRDAFRSRGRMTSRQFRLFALVVGTIAWLGAGGEALTRFEGDWRLDTLTLTRNDRIKAVAAEPGDGERKLSAQTTYQKGVDPEWFFLRLAPLAMPRNAELEARSDANPAVGQGLENFIWNDASLANPTADFVDMVRDQKVRTIFAFQSFDGSPYPHYRLYPSNGSSSWVTNRWGWLGTDTGVRKPPRTIRVGMLGDFHDAQSLYVKSAELSQCVGHSK